MQAEGIKMSYEQLVRISQELDEALNRGVEKYITLLRDKLNKAVEEYYGLAQDV